NKEIRGIPTGFLMCGAAILQHPRERPNTFPVNPELPRIHAGLVANCGGFAPNQFRAASAKAFVTPERQLIWQTIERSIAALHGLNRQSIANVSRSHADGLEERRQIVLESERDS